MWSHLDKVTTVARSTEQNMNCQLAKAQGTDPLNCGLVPFMACMSLPSVYIKDNPKTSKSNQNQRQKSWIYALMNDSIVLVFNRPKFHQESSLVANSAISPSKTYYQYSFFFQPNASQVYFLFITMVTT